MGGARVAGPGANAWLLDFGHDARGAVATRVLLHLLDNPQVFAVPCTPSYCRHAVFWQNRLLPVMDMAARLGGPPQQSSLLAVACYVDPLDTVPRFGALALSAVPVPVAVNDNTACALPEQPAGWSGLALSCFEHHGQPVPILHLGRIFGPAPAK